MKTALIAEVSGPVEVVLETVVRCTDRASLSLGHEVEIRDGAQESGGMMRLVVSRNEPMKGVDRLFPREGPRVGN
jgi:hypothetical protein